MLSLSKSALARSDGRPRRYSRAFCRILAYVTNRGSSRVACFMPVGLRTGFELTMADRQIIADQEPLLSPQPLTPRLGVQWQTCRIPQPWQLRKSLPMVLFCVKVAIFQLKNNRYFIIENPAGSKMWWLDCNVRLLRELFPGTHCARLCLGVAQEMWAQPSNGCDFTHFHEMQARGVHHQHERLEGNAAGHALRKIG